MSKKIRNSNKNVVKLNSNFVIEGDFMTEIENNFKENYRLLDDARKIYVAGIIRGLILNKTLDVVSNNKTEKSKK